MLSKMDRNIINKCLDEFLKNNVSHNIVELKLKVWDFANLLSATGAEIDEDLINKVINDLFLFKEGTSVNYDWALNDEIVDNDLCAKCGTCSVVCPNELIEFKEKPCIVDECLRKGQGMCKEVCPRQIAGSYDVRNRLNLFEEYYYSKSYIDGQSGGVVTKFLQYLLDDGEIDGAIVIGANNWKPVSMIVTSSKELFDFKNNVDTSKSKYAISSLQAIREAGKLGLEKIAVVGLPCQVAGLRNIQYHSYISKHGPEVGKEGEPAKIPKIEYILGLFCTEKFEYSEFVDKVNSLNIPMEDVIKCDVKGKNFVISTENKDCTIDLKEINASKGCLMCKDFDAELADISFGDKGSPNGFSTIVIRTDKGKIIKKYFDLNDDVKVDEINFMREFKEKRFNKEVLRRKENDEHNSYYYIWKHGGVGAAQNNKVYLRFRTTIGGYYNPKLLIKISEVAEKFKCKIKLTSREEIELQDVELNNIENLIKEFEEMDILINGTEGPLFRSIMACPGSKHCTLGLIDTNEIVSNIERDYAEKPSNYKFKLGITGCPNRCLAVSTTDFGINGVKFPQVTNECNGCGRCQDVCKVDAIDMEEKNVINKFVAMTNYNLCIGCGKCIKACPSNSRSIKFEGYSLYIGGKGGRETIVGHHILVRTKEEIYSTLKAVFEIYNKLSIKPQKERLAHTMQRIGIEEFMDKVDKYKLN